MMNILSDSRATAPQDTNAVTHARACKHANAHQEHAVTVVTTGRLHTSATPMSRQNMHARGVQDADRT